MSERQKYRPSVFLSYASRGTDAEFALALRSALVEHKIVVPAWRDKGDLRPGARAIADIQAGIAGCDFQGEKRGQPVVAMSSVDLRKVDDRRLF
jgi:hypothetical protein